MFTVVVLCPHCDENHREVTTEMDFGARTVHIDHHDYSDYSSSTHVAEGPVMTFAALRDALDRGADLLAPLDRWGSPIKPVALTDRLWTPADAHGAVNMALSRYLTQWCALGCPAYLAPMTYDACREGGRGCTATASPGFDEISEAFLADTPHFRSLAAIAEDALLKSFKW